MNMESQKKTQRAKRAKKEPNLVVDPYTGKEFNKADGVKIYNGYLIPKDDVVEFAGNKYSLHDPHIATDCITKKKFHVSYVRWKNVILEEPEVLNSSHGYFKSGRTITEVVTFTTKTGDEYYIPISFVEKYGLIENYDRGSFVVPGTIVKGGKSQYRRFSAPSIDYNSEKDLIKYGIKSPTNIITEGKGYTFGVEIETSLGMVPEHIAKDLNMSCDYDGSIRTNGNKGLGGEYITGVLYGDNGFRHLQKILSELNKRTQINKTCSIHVHVGNIIFNKEFVVLLWRLATLIQAELFSMMPPSRRNNPYCNGITGVRTNIKTDLKKGISYEMEINTLYQKMVKVLSLGRPLSSKINKKYNHPAGKWCGYDRTTPRYWWLNFIPAVFNLKGEGNFTIEFRNHSATLNFEKIKNWILICFGIVSFVKNNKRKIINQNKITLREIMEAEYPLKGKYLADYIDKRKALFSENGSGKEAYEYIRDKKDEKVLKLIEII